MIDVKGPYRIGALCVAAGAALQVIAPVFGGFSVPALTLGVMGLVYAGMALGLANGWRWLAYLVFLLLIIDGIAAITGIWANGPVPGWIYAAKAMANGVGVAALFAALWRRAPVAADG